MLFFLAILALAAVSLLMVRAMAVSGVKPATEARPPRARISHAPARQVLDAAALQGLY
ncbi:hypothetical protein [Acidocella sp.]|uniref:hypothetical protein n=1 Tax=Acidocella sp. TaxID=50710 RepID=UPI003D027EEF